MKHKEQTIDDFWDKYYNADGLEREKIVEKLVSFPIVQDIRHMVNIKSGEIDVYSHSMKTMLRGYFDDLIEYMEKRKR